MLARRTRGRGRHAASRVPASQGRRSVECIVLVSSLRSGAVGADAGSGMGRARAGFPEARLKPHGFGFVLNLPFCEEMRMPAIATRDPVPADWTEERMWSANCAHSGVSMSQAHDLELWRGSWIRQIPWGRSFAARPTVMERCSVLRTTSSIRTRSVRRSSVTLKTCGSSRLRAGPASDGPSSMLSSLGPKSRIGAALLAHRDGQCGSTLAV